jgi:Fe-S-cluster-containing hydrogenase component 2
MEHIGLNPERLRVEFMSAGDGILFTEGIEDFVKTVKALGPLGEAEKMNKSELASKLAEVTRLVPYIKIAKQEKLAARLENEDAYASHFTSAEIDRLFKEVVSYYIDPQKCQACMICLRKCPVEAIAGAKNRIHVIDQGKCIKCETCFDACPSRFGAVKKMTGEPVPPPIPEEERIIVRKSMKKR